MSNLVLEKPSFKNNLNITNGNEKVQIKTDDTDIVEIEIGDMGEYVRFPINRDYLNENNKKSKINFLA